MTAISTQATGSGDSNSTASYVGGVVPGDGDTLTIQPGFSLNINHNLTLGSNASGVGDALDVQGTIIGGTGYTLTLKGYDKTSNRAFVCSGTWNFAGKVKVPSVSEYQTVGSIASGAVFQPASGAVFEGDDPHISTWNKTINYEAVPTFLNRSGYDIKGRNIATGFVANLASDGLGAYGDSSFVVDAVTNPSGILATEVENQEDLSSHGDYWIDYHNCVLLFYTTSQPSYYAFQYHMDIGRWYGWGIESTADADKQILIDGCTFRYMGAPFGTTLDSVNDYATINCSHHKSVGSDAARGMSITNSTFEWCMNPIQMYSCEGNSSNYIDLTGNSYLYTPPGDSGNYRGASVIGISSKYIDTSDAVCDSRSYIYNGFISDGFVKVNNCSGRIGENLASCTEGLEANDGNYTSWGSIPDGSGFSSKGTSSNPNEFQRNTIKYGHRCGRIGSNLIVKDNKFFYFNHHGFVGPIDDGFYQNITIEGNIIAQTYGDMSGGWTLGYNYTHWLHNVSILNNTFDTGSRGIQFNDGEGTVVLGTKLRILNNIISNTSNGINRPANDSSNQTKIQLDWMDYNDDYNNAAADVAQATFIMSGAHYGSDEGNCLGVALQNPSDAPDATGRDLVMVVGSGSTTLSWGGGTPVEIVDDTGTATGGDWNTITDSTKSWSTNEHRCKNVRLTSGDMAGNVYMVKSNSSTSLELQWPSGNTSYTAILGVDYEIINPEVELTDTGANTVDAGISIFELPTAADTYTDSNIIVQSNSFSVDPLYVSTSTYDYTPQEETLFDAGYDGSDIGAISSGEAPVEVPESPNTEDNLYDFFKNLSYLGALVDMWYAWLGDQEYTGSLEDRMYAWLEDLGYSGSLPDKLYQYWLDH